MTLPRESTTEPFARAAPIDPIQYPPRVRRRLFNALITRNRGDPREDERRRRLHRRIAATVIIAAIDRPPRREVQRERVIVPRIAIHPKRRRCFVRNSLRRSQHTTRTRRLVNLYFRHDAAPVSLIRLLLILHLARALPRHRPVRPPGAVCRH